MKQCNAMESCTMFMTFFPYFVILIWFLKKHRLTVLLKAVIIHATLSYLSQISLGTPLEYMSCLIYSLDNFGVTVMEPFNQSTEIPGFFTPPFLFKNIDEWELLICPYVHLRLIHDAPYCPSVRLWGTNRCLSSWPCGREPIGWELLICP